MFTDTAKNSELIAQSILRLHRICSRTTKSLFVDFTRSSHRHVLGGIEKYSTFLYFITNLLFGDLVDDLTLNILSVRINFCNFFFYLIEIKYPNYFQSPSTTSRAL